MEQPSIPLRSRPGLLLIALALGLTSCQPPPSDPGSEPQGGPLRVVATTTLIADWAHQVGGDQIQLTSLLEPGNDPHLYEPVPADTVALEQADLIFYNGYNLEPGLIRLMAATGQQERSVALAEVVPPLTSQAPGQSVPDPHVWGDVSLVEPMVERLREELMARAPDRSAEFRDRSDRYLAELQELHQWIQDQTATIPPDQRQLVTTHDAFQYYARAYGLTVVGTLIGISTEEQPSAQTVRQLVDRISALGVPAIFTETTLNPSLITTVATEAGVSLAPTALYSDSLGVAGSPADTYLKMMIANTRTIVENLGGQIKGQ
ncbi:MAG: zinc ABC transporter substrate-binding protein [Cyanobacteriota bacterium]|nr:zinc ABC transporter substrate-binding protein [Cyanobacteriota bacterium]